MKQFDKAIAVLRAAQILLEEKRAKQENGLDKFMTASQISGLDLAIKCLEEVNE